MEAGDGAAGNAAPVIANANAIRHVVARVTNTMSATSATVETDERQENITSTTSHAWAVLFDERFLDLFDDRLLDNKPCQTWRRVAAAATALCCLRLPLY
jgi:hypothetical protein